jgi:hypothetical protein
MKISIYLLKIFLCIIIVMASWQHATAQYSNDDFVKYRLQCKQYHWQQYSNKKYDLFYSKEADSLAKYIVENTNNMLKALEDSTLLEFDGKINIIVYNSASDEQQSNIGQFFEKMKLSNAISFTNNRIVISYKGSKQVLLNDLHLALCKTIFQSNFYGNQLEQVIKNIANTNLPLWFTQGVPTYYHQPWSVPNDALFKELLMVEKPKTFQELEAQNAQITGNAFMYYVSQKFGVQYVNNFIFQVKQNKDIALSASLTFKKPLWWLQQNALVFFANRYATDIANADTIAVSSKINQFSIYKNKFRNAAFQANTIQLSQDGKLLAVIQNGTNAQKIIIKNCLPSNKKNTQNVILHLPKESANITLLPIIKWHATNNQLLCIYQQQGLLKIKVFVISKNGKVLQTITREIPEIDAVTSIAFTNKPNVVLLTGSYKGQTDIYSYHYQSNKIQQVTDDYYEEDKIEYYQFDGKDGAIFISNNATDSINTNTSKYKKGNQRIQFVSYNQMQDLATEKVKFIKLEMIDSCKKDVFIHQIQQGAVGGISILTDENGSMQLYNYAKKEKNNWEMNAEKLSNLPSSIYTIAKVIKDNTMITAMQIGDSIVVLASTLKKQDSTNLTIFRNEYLLHQQLKLLQSSVVLVPKDENKSIVLQMFAASADEKKQYKDTIKAQSLFNVKRINPYKLQLSSEYVIAGIDNNILMNQYQPYSLQQGQFHQPNLSGIGKYNFTNLFEDIKVQAGFRLPSNGKGSDYFLVFNNYKKRNDWSISYFRHTEKYTLSNGRNWITSNPIVTPSYLKQITHYAQFLVTHPFATYHGIDATIALLYNKQIFLAIDKYSLFYPDTFQLWSLAKVNYQFDKTTNKLINIKNGFHFKTFLEYQFQIAKKQIGFIHTGFIGKAFLPIYKNMIWANQLSMATSIGSENNGIMYSLGGVSNWIAPIADSSVQFNSTDNYQFTSAAYQLRGYALHIRNGNTYYLLNSEIRIPLLNTFFPIVTKFNPINNLQFILFSDIGNAYKTPDLRKSIIPKPVVSYGFCARTSLLNYFIKLDCAWRNTVQQKSKSPMVMLSLGMDF